MYRDGKMQPNKSASPKARSVTLGPNGSYPAGDIKHARLAAQMAPEGLKTGHLTKVQEVKIERGAHAIIARSKPAKSAMGMDFATGKKG